MTEPPEGSGRGVDVLAVLAGAKVRRVDVPDDALVVLTLFVAGQGELVFVLSVAPHAPGLGLVGARPRGAPAGSFAQLLRKRLLGAALSRWTALAESTLAIDASRSARQSALGPEGHPGGAEPNPEGRTRLVARLGRRPMLAVLDEEGRALATAPTSATFEIPPSEPSADDWPRDLDELRVAGAALLTRRASGGREGRAAELERAMRRARTKVERRAQAIARDLAATEEAPRLRSDAGLLLASLHLVPARAATVTLPDPETGEPRSLVLDPTRSATAQAEHWFARARKLDRGAKIAGERLAQAQRELGAIDAARVALEDGDTSLAEALSRPAPVPAERAATPRRAPHRTFVLEDGSVILVGRSARDNDALTFRVASPADHFFHARAVTGAHVILRDVPGRDPSEQAVRAAAILAAHFSVARGQSAADVSRARKSDLRRGKAPGQVVMRASTTLRVRWTEEDERALFARERA